MSLFEAGRIGMRWVLGMNRWNIAGLVRRKFGGFERHSHYSKLPLLVGFDLIKSVRSCFMNAWSSSDLKNMRRKSAWMESVVVEWVL